MNAFDHTAYLSDLKVTGSGGSEYIVALLTTTLQNPSSVSLNTIDMSLPVLYQGVAIGRAVISVGISAFLFNFMLNLASRTLN